MKYREYSHRHGKELLQVLHSGLLTDVKTILDTLAPFAHGAEKGRTVKNYLTKAFVDRGWETEVQADFKAERSDTLDLGK